MRTFTVSTLCLLLAFCAVTVLLAEKLLADDSVTEITGPLVEDGLIDFFKAFENFTYPPEFATDENGFRIFLRTFGPAGPSESFGDYYRQHAYEKLGLDPNTLPTLKYQHSPDSIILDYYTAKGEHYDSTRDGSVQFPWTLEQFPMLADWVKTKDEQLDAIAEMIRKPVFHPPLLPAPEWFEPESPKNIISTILLPDYQLSRDIVRHFQARAMYRVGRGDIDDAIGDKLLIPRLGRQIAFGGNLIPLLVGMAHEFTAAALPMDANPNSPLTKEHIQHIVAGLDALPPRIPTSLVYEAERLHTLSVVQDLAVAHTRRSLEFSRQLRDTTWLPVESVILLPGTFDWNSVYRRVNEIYDMADEPEKFQALYEAAHQRVVDGSLPDVARTFLTRDGLEMYVADYLFCYLSAGTGAAGQAVQRMECADNFQRLIWAIKMYELDHGGLPQSTMWPQDIAQYLCGDSSSEQFYSCFSCPSNPSPQGMTTYALVEYNGEVPEGHETIILAELTIPVPLDQAFFTVDEVLELSKKYRLRPQSSPHPGLMMTARRSGAVIATPMNNEEDLLRLLGREQ